MTLPGGDQAAEAVARWRDRGGTVATAESLTGGLLGAALTSVPGASAVFLGGVISYATVAKSELAQVPGETLRRNGPVAADTAVAMAAGVRRMLGATAGVATTGVAGPDDQDGHPPGTVYVAVVMPAGPGTAVPRAGNRRRADEARTDAVAGIRVTGTSAAGADAAGASMAGENTAGRGVVVPAVREIVIADPVAPEYRVRALVGEFSATTRIPGDRADVRAASTIAALELLARAAVSA